MCEKNIVNDKIFSSWYTIGSVCLLQRQISSTWLTPAGFQELDGFLLCGAKLMAYSLSPSSHSLIYLFLSLSLSHLLSLWLLILYFSLYSRYSFSFSLDCFAFLFFSEFLSNFLRILRRLENTLQNLFHLLMVCVQILLMSTFQRMVYKSTCHVPQVDVIN